MYQLLTILLTGFFMLSCSKKDQVTDSNSVATQNIKQENNTTDNSKPPPVLNITIEPRISKGLQGDFTNVGFSIQSKPWTPIIKGKLDCTLHGDLKATCQLQSGLDKLQNGQAYRLLIYTIDNKNPDNTEGLACDYFIYNHGQPHNLNITPSTTGECILWQLKHDTGYDEQEIKNRIRHILNGDEASEDYDLEMTLYDLFKFYDGEKDWQKAWKKLVETIRNNRPLPKDDDSTIHGASRLF